MEYQIIKAYNNNVVLAKDKDDKQIIIVSKGIGFNKKSGDIISKDASIEKVFHEINPTQNTIDFQKLINSSEEITHVTKEIIKAAEKKIGKLNEEVENTLKEHIEFAIERLKMGLNIENPFLEEIMYLYQEEYQAARLAYEIILEKLGIVIGEKEQGFIALHFHAARYGESISKVMKNIRFYKGCKNLIEQRLKIESCLQNGTYNDFFSSLKLYVDLTKSNKQMVMNSKEAITKNLKESYHLATVLSQYVKKEKELVFSEDVIAFLTVDIEKLNQIINIS